MSTQKKQVPKGVRLGWKPLKEVKSVKLTPDLLQGEKVAAKHCSPDAVNLYLIP
jgi:hypothetical protein